MQDDLSKANAILHAGGLVAIPTETVYGLAADARNPIALAKIFQAKGRPADHPLIVHIADIAQLSAWAREVPACAYLLAKAFWPGPLTLILKKAPHVVDLITGAQDTIGIRVPNHPVALALLKLFGGGLAAPSANRFGRISPTTAQAVREELGDTVDSILDGGMCAVGVESTIVDVSRERVTILRPGMISAAQIAAVIQEPVYAKGQDAPRVSGSMLSHYAPSTATYLVAPEELDAVLQKNAVKVAVVTRRKNIISTDKISVIKMPHDVQHYAHDLYQTLRELDKKELQKIIIERVPVDSEWEAVLDRLRRASL